MTDTQSGTNGGAQAQTQENSEISTWGDVADMFGSDYAIPDDATQSDTFTKSEFNSRFNALADQIDESDFETLLATTDDLRTGDRVRLFARMAERGTGATDGNQTVRDIIREQDLQADGGRTNAIEPSWSDQDGGPFSQAVPEWATNENQRQNASPEDISVGDDPFDEDSDSAADRSAIRTDGPLQPNAGEKKPETPVGGFSGVDRVNAKTPDQISPFGESTESKLTRVSDRANAVYGKLNAEGPLTKTALADAWSGSRLDATKAIDELQYLDLIEDVAYSSPAEYASVDSEADPDPRSEAFDSYSS